MATVTSSTSKQPIFVESLEDEFGEIVSRKQGQRPDYTVHNPMEPLSGFTNYTIEQMTAINKLQKQMIEVYEKNGYTGLVLRPLEYAQLLLQKGGIEKQMWGVSRLQDGSLTKYALPFDRTVPLAIFIAQHINEITFPFFRHDTGWVYRGERPSGYRRRAFKQTDIDIISRSPSIKEDAQVAVVILQALQAAAVPKYVMYVNHVAVAKGFMVIAGIKEEFFGPALRAIDKLKPDNRKEVVAELVANISELTEERARILLETMSYEGPILDFTPPKDFPETAMQGLQSLIDTEKMITAMGIEQGSVQFRSFLTRGLDYYTGIVYETFIPGHERLGSIASGGRYGNLIDDFSKTKTGLGGVGISIGLTRLFDIMQALKAVELTKQTCADMFVGYRSEDEYFTAMQLATALRSRGIKTEIYLEGKKPKITTQLDLCAKKNIPFAALVMNKEEFELKELNITTTQTSYKQLKERAANSRIFYKTIDEFVPAALKALHAEGR